MKIEPIKPFMIQVPKTYKNLPAETPYVQVETYEEMQNGWDFGEELNVFGKINKIIEILNLLTQE